MMIMRTLLLSGLLLTAIFSFAQNKYPVAAIPESLRKNAHVVKRMEELRFEVVRLNETIYTRKFALTILDEQGQEFAELVVGYDKLKKINHIEGALYDASGNQIKKIKGKDIRDLSAVQEISLFDDNRLKVHDFEYHSYPYTVEYEVEAEFNHTFYFPSWKPQSSDHLAVEQSSYTFVAPADYQLRYKAYNYKGEPLASTNNGKKQVRWEVKNQASIQKPYASPSWNELTTYVFLSSSDFEIEGYKGNSSSWAEFGKFFLALNQGRDKLPDPVIQKVASLTSGVADPKEKVYRLYHYLQQNTRYISIQLGLGGFQPFEASYVSQKGYGDCKALSNFMYSLLKVAGIKSHPVLINAGREPDAKSLVEELPSTQFNHMVLCVPFVKDTLWLECTSQSDPAGYMGGFTGNRKALAITEEGGKLVGTPRYGLDENLQLRKIKAVLDGEGNLQAVIHTIYKAQQQDYVFSMLNMLSKDRVKKMLNEELDFSTYDINDFSYKAKKETLPEVEEELKLSVSGYATVSGKRLFILPNLMTRSSHHPIDAAERTVDYVFDYAYRDIDSVEITIPAGYSLESLPEEKKIETAYGNYHSIVKVEGSKIIYYRKLDHFAGRYAAKEGEALEKFFTDIYKADRSRVVLVKKES